MINAFKEWKLEEIKYVILSSPATQLLEPETANRLPQMEEEEENLGSEHDSILVDQEFGDFES